MLSLFSIQSNARAHRHMQPPTHTHTIRSTNLKGKSGSYTAAWVWFRCGEFIFFFSRSSKARDYHTCSKNQHTYRREDQLAHMHTNTEEHCTENSYISCYVSFSQQKITFSRKFYIPEESSTSGSCYCTESVSNKAAAFVLTNLISLKFKIKSHCPDLHFKSWINSALPFLFGTI